MLLYEIARNGAINGAINLIDQGTTNPNGKILIYDTGRVTLLAEIELNNPSFAAPVVGTRSMILVPDVQDTAANATGVAAEFDIVDRDVTPVFAGSVGVTGKDLNLNSVNLEAGVPVKMTSCNITMPAGTVA